MAEIKFECCAGNEKYSGHCIKTRCPIYQKVKEVVDRAWPYVGTGFGNLYGNPNHEIYISEVRYILERKGGAK